MRKILDLYADKIKRSFSFFDRMIINGYFRPFLSERMRSSALYQLGVLYKDFKAYFMNVTKSLTEHIEDCIYRSRGALAGRNIQDSAIGLGRPIKYLSFSNIRKEDVAKDFPQSDPVDDGLICVLKALEFCKTAKVYGSDSGNLIVKSVYTKCLHYYLYYLDKEYGFMFVKILTWFPFNIQVYINERELMKHVFDKNSIVYECYDNFFTSLSDAAKTQELAGKFDSSNLSRHLDRFAKSINPFFDTVMKVFGQGFYWCVNQCEFATDIMFKERSFLEDIYPSLVGNAFYDFTCTDVLTFLGQKPDPRFQGEAVSDFKDRPIGCRVKFKLKSNSIKMHDKCSVLRIETTINDPREFKIFGTVHHHDGSESRQWKPMGKSIANLYRYIEISKPSNAKFLDSMVDIVPVKSTLKEIEDICSGKKVNDKRVSGFNVWTPEVVAIMETVCDGSFLVRGFRNIDIRRIALPSIKGQKKQSSKMSSRILKKLRQHGLIKKSSKSRLYHVTSKGHRVLALSLVYTALLIHLPSGNTGLFQDVFSEGKRGFFRLYREDLFSAFMFIGSVKFSL